ncbi:hypothetical protein ABMA79_14140 [Halobacteriovorax sp. HFRX-2_2]|uniref:hypothetical protein n=1 Tax=unclassified Halobacteriovorax TaxID=2639665 RepID=UPI003716F2FE
MIKFSKLILICLFSYFSFGDVSSDLSSGRNIRDPFKVKYKKKMGNKKARREKFTGFSNKLTTDHLRIDRLRVTGIFLGKDARAIIKQVDDEGLSEAVIIKEGMKIGPDQVEVKAILPGGVVLVEKIINVYDEEEYLETILPLSE